MINLISDLTWLSIPITIIIAIYYLSDLLLFTRNKLIKDLKVLNRLNELDNEKLDAEKVKTQIKKEINSIYGEKTLYDLIGGIVLTGLSAFLLYRLITTESPGNIYGRIFKLGLIILVFFLLLGGLGGIQEFFQKRKKFK